MSDLSGLEFSFEEFRSEIQVMSDLAKPLLTQESVRMLQGFEQTVKHLGEQRTERRCSLELEDRNGFGGVRTHPSREYEREKVKGKEMSAELRSLWEVMPIASGKKSRPPSRFRLVGVASTRISIKNDCGEILACWQTDIADQGSPGCYFHIQVKQDCNKPPFPDWLSVPRFPSLLVTPMAALDFVLGELFQKRWLQLTSGGDYAAQRWRKIQRTRWQRLLKWHLDWVQDSGETCSPWLSIKGARPPADLFFRS
jgi:hypothetical protein